MNQNALISLINAVVSGEVLDPKELRSQWEAAAGVPKLDTDNDCSKLLFEIYTDLEEAVVHLHFNPDGSLDRKKWLESSDRLAVKIAKFAVFNKLTREDYLTLSQRCLASGFDTPISDSEFEKLVQTEHRSLKK